MKDVPDSQAPSPDGSLSLDGFQQPAEEHGLSLEELSTAYAELLQRGSSPYDESTGETPPEESVAEEPLANSAEEVVADAGCDLTPKSILEAMLFVGNLQNQPLTARQVASLMRGVRPQEIDDLVQELNIEYASQGCPYSIQSVEAGYALRLREEYAHLRESFYGRIKDAKLTQQAVDVLAIVAYKQPMTRDEVDTIRGRPCGSILSQLVRRELLRIDRPSGKDKTVRYRTTDRFLQVFGLASLDELPDSEQ